MPLRELLNRRRLLGKNPSDSRADDYGLGRSITSMTLHKKPELQIVGEGKFLLPSGLSRCK
jgi:hypothetical protein